jgi:hypothetical protein
VFRVCTSSLCEELYNANVNCQPPISQRAAMANKHSTKLPIAAVPNALRLSRSSALMGKYSARFRAVAFVFS